MAQLKDSIKQVADLGDKYEIILEKYIDVDLLTSSMNLTSIEPVERETKGVYDVYFKNKGKVVEIRKGIIKNNKLHVAREKNAKKLSFYQIYLVFSLFGR